ncbi:MAG: GAF domain-containing protein, partial [Bacteroidetes bacterium]|nr:GAF domain-containing protein [Bacteroidota bacterium]
MNKEEQNLRSENEKLRKQIIDLEILVKTKVYKDKSVPRNSPFEKIRKLNECLLKNTKDPIDNINRLVGLCGEILRADAAFYNKLSGNDLVTSAVWNAPKGYQMKFTAKGRVCTDVIKGKFDENPVVLKDLKKTDYFNTDPNIEKYNMSTYVGLPVKWKNKNIGSLSAVFVGNKIPDEEDIEFVNIISSAISIEEDRKRAVESA